MLCYCSSTSSQSSWVVSKHEDGIKVSIKNTEGNSFKSFKVETTFNAEFETVLAVLLDVENIPSYYEMIFDVQDIKEISPQEATYTLYFDFPWPVKNRFCHVESHVDVNGDGSVSIFTNRVNGEKTPKFVQAAEMKSVWILKRSKDKTTEVMHSGFMDPGGQVPAWLAKEQTTKNPFKTIQRMRSRFIHYKSTTIPFLD